MLSDIGSTMHGLKEGKKAEALDVSIFKGHICYFSVGKRFHAQFLLFLMFSV